MGNPTNRLTYIDIAKGIGMIMVVLGHAYLLPESIGKVIFSVHMPLFFILSGYCFRYRPEETNGTFLKKNAKGLLLPYALTSGIVVLYQVFMTVKYRENVWECIRNWVLAALYGSGAKIPESLEDLIFPIGVIWFLLALFIGKMIFRLILTSRVPWIWALVLFFASYISTDLFWLPFSIQPGCCSVLFLYTGYAMRKENLWEAKAISIPLYICSALVWVYCCIHCGVLWMVENCYEHGFLDLIGAVCGTVVIVGISRLIERFIKPLKAALAVVGRASLGIMCAHLIVLHLWQRSRYMNLLVDGLHWSEWVSDFCVVAVLTAACAAILYVVPWLGGILFPAKHRA